MLNKNKTISNDFYLNSIYNKNIIDDLPLLSKYYSGIKYVNYIDGFYIEKFGKRNNFDMGEYNKFYSADTIEYSNINRVEEFNDSIMIDSLQEREIDKDSTTDNDRVILENNLLINYANIFYNLSKIDVIEDGFFSDSEKFILDIMKYDTNLAISILAKASTMYYDKETVLISLLHIMSGFKIDIINCNPFIKPLATSCLANKSDLVKDQALKFFYNCGDRDDVNILENIEPFKKNWLEDYRKEIINNLKK